MTIYSIVVNNNGKLEVLPFTNHGKALSIYVEMAMNNGCAETEDEEISIDELEQYLINEARENGSHNSTETYHISLTTSTLLN